jgi:hypothetical protein
MRNPNIHYGFIKGWPFVHILSMSSSAHIPVPTLFKVCFNITLPSVLDFIGGLFPSGFLISTYVNNYEVVSKIFRTGAAIYTAVVVGQRICPNRPNCEFRVLLLRFAATA